MSGGITIRLDGAAKTQSALRNLASASGLTLREVCQDNMRLWSLAAFRIAAPQTLEKARKQLRRQVSSTVAGVSNNRLLDILRGWADRGRLPGASVARWATIDNMMSWHAAHRGQKAKAIARIGRMTVRSKLYTSPDARDRLFATIERRIGRLKSGWEKPVAHWAAISHGPGVKGFGWLKDRAFEKDYEAGGTITRAGNGSIFSENSTPYIGLHGNMPKDKLDAATRIRLADLERHALKRVDKMRAQFGKG